MKTSTLNLHSKPDPRHGDVCLDAPGNPIWSSGHVQARLCTDHGHCRNLDPSTVPCSGGLSQNDSKMIHYCLHHLRLPWKWNCRGRAAVSTWRCPGILQHQTQLSNTRTPEFLIISKFRADFSTFYLIYKLWKWHLCRFSCSTCSHIGSLRLHFPWGEDLALPPLCRGSRKKLYGLKEQTVENLPKCRQQCI